MTEKVGGLSGFHTWFAAAVLGLLCATPALAADSEVTPRIVGGEPALPDTWPSVVQILFEVAPGEGGFCGGTLIDRRFVLTAGHCVTLLGTKIELNADAFRILSGTQTLYGTDGTELRVKHVNLHPGYEPGAAPVNDIALLELTVDSDLEIMPLVVQSPAPGTWATIVGWGTVIDDSTAPLAELLQEADVPVVSNSDCERAYGDIIEPTMLCAGFPTGGVDACYGDSGGPLMVLNNNDVYEQAGITSAGAGCARTYGIYTRISSYLPWIDQYVPVLPDDGTDGGGGGGAVGPWWAIGLLGLAVVPAAVRRRRVLNG